MADPFTLASIARIALPMAHNFLSGRRQDKYDKRLAKAQRHANLVNALSRGRLDSKVTATPPKAGFLEKALGAADVGFKAYDTFQTANRAKKLYDQQSTLNELNIDTVKDQKGLTRGVELFHQGLKMDELRSEPEAVVNGYLSAWRQSNSDRQAQDMTQDQQSFSNELDLMKLGADKAKANAAQRSASEKHLESQRVELSRLYEIASDDPHIKRWMENAGDMKFLLGAIESYAQDRRDGKNPGALQPSLIQSLSRHFSDEAVTQSDADNMRKALNFGGSLDAFWARQMNKGGMISDTQLQSMIDAVTIGLQGTQQQALRNLDTIIAGSVGKTLDEEFAPVLRSRIIIDPISIDPPRTGQGAAEQSFSKSPDPEAFFDGVLKAKHTSPPAEPVASPPKANNYTMPEPLRVDFTGGQASRAPQSSTNNSMQFVTKQNLDNLSQNMQAGAAGIWNNKKNILQELGRGYTQGMTGNVSTKGTGGRIFSTLSDAARHIPGPQDVLNTVPRSQGVFNTAVNASPSLLPRFKEDEEEKRRNQYGVPMLNLNQLLTGRRR